MENKQQLTSNIEQLEYIRQLALTNRFELLNTIDKLPVGVCVTDSEGYFSDMNSTYLNIYGYRREEMIGKHFTMVVPEAEKNPMRKLHDNCIAGEKELHAIWNVRDKSGRIFSIVANAAVIHKKDGEPVKVTFVADLSNIKQTEVKLNRTIQYLDKHLKRLENKLEKQDMAESLLLHDIKKPLRNVIGICDLLLKADLPKEEQKQWLGMIRELEEKGLHLLQTLTGFKKIESGTYQPDWQSVNLIELLEEIRRGLLVSLRDKAMKFELDSGPAQEQDFMIEADAPFLELMLNNLITNAVEASPEGKTIKVNLNHENGYILIDIHNLGTVPEEIRDNFFDKYVSSGKARGTGLGTYIAREIALLHEGQIEMESSEEKGTSLTVQLPVSHS